MSDARSVPSRPVRRDAKEASHGELLRMVTVRLLETYQHCSADFAYQPTAAPRRVLTKLSKGVHNGGYDNAEHDYICRVGDKIVNPDGQSYEILERLGHGTFGQVLKCQSSSGSSHVALKIIKNKPAYFHQALVEVRILQMLNQEYDAHDEERIVRMLDYFVYRKHLCISFEILSVNLYEVLKQNSFQGVSMALIRVLTEQLLKALRCLRQASVIHCDLKPENVLLSNMHHTKIKLIDFGSACFESHTVYPYIQSRFYRSPEVLLGVPYTSAIDMWSLGCICAELFLGLPVFPGTSEYDQVCRIVEVQGHPPSGMLDVGKNSRRYFRKVEVRPTETAGSGEGASGSGEGAASDGDRSPTSPTSPRLAEKLEDEGGRPAKSAEEAAAEAAAPAASENKAEKDAGSSSKTHRSSNFLEQLKQRLGLADEGEDALQAASKGASDGGSAGEGRSIGSASTATRQETTDSSRHRPSSGEQPTPEGQSEDRESGVLPQRPLGLRPTGRSKRRLQWRLKTREEYERDEHKKEPTPKKYFNFNSLESMVGMLPFRPNLTRRQYKDEHSRRICFLHFLTHVLQMNPNLRWTAKQASAHPFITGDAHEPNWTPPEDIPIASFSQAAPPSRASQGVPGEVPPLPSAAMGLLKEGEGGAFSGGGSARTHDESKPRQDGTAAPGQEAEQPRSAPATTRGGQGQNDAASLSKDAIAAALPKVLQSMGLPPDASAAPESALRGLWGHLCMGIPLPDSNPAESYRPPLDELSEAFFRNLNGQLMAAQDGSKSNPFETSCESHAVPSTGSPPKVRSATGSVSTGASLCSSASSTGSTPTGRSHRTGSMGSPLMRSSLVPPHGDSRLAGLSRVQLSGSTMTPASSPHGSVTSSAQAPAAQVTNHHGQLAASGGNRPSSGSMGSLVPPAHTPHRGGSGASTISAPRLFGSRDGSRGSSPWNLPSPMSELSMASNLNSSHVGSGTDSGCEHPSQHYNFDMAALEDPSGQSDTAHWPRSNQHSDSDCATPNSHDTPGGGGVGSSGGGASQKDVMASLWDNVKSEMSRVELMKDKLPRRLDNIQSPGSTGVLSNFREAVGMNDNGPVIPFGHGTARRDAISLRTPSSGSQTAPTEEPNAGVSNQSSAGATAGGLGTAGTGPAGAGPGAGFGAFNPMSRSANDVGGGFSLSSGPSASPRRTRKKPA